MPLYRGEIYKTNITYVYDSIKCQQVEKVSVNQELGKEKE